MKTFLLFLLLQSFFVYRQTWGLDIGPYFTPCSAKDPQLSECVRTQGQKLIPLVAGGIKELNLQSLDPLRTSEITFTDHNGGNSLVSHYRNVEQIGFSTIQIENSDVDLLHGVMTFKLKYPRIIFTADYEAKGKFYDFDFDGNGKANISVWNAFSSFVLKYRVVDDHIKLKSIIIGFSFDKIFMDYTNLIINGDKELSESASNFINENAEEIIDGFKPQLEKFYSDINMEFLQIFFDAVPYSVLFKNVTASNSSSPLWMVHIQHSVAVLFVNVSVLVFHVTASGCAT